MAITDPVPDPRLHRPARRTRLTALNSRLLRECRQLALDDGAGRAWSRTNYPGGYTSYSSASRLHQMSPTFAQLEKRIDAHVRSFARALDFDLTGRKLVMTDCWVNVMTRQVVHGLHLHPLASISGTYYVRTPRGCSGLKFEDPRLDRYMAAPPRKRTRAAREPGLGHDSRRAGQPGAVRELAAPRGGAEPDRGGADLGLVQLFLVLRRARIS